MYAKRAVLAAFAALFMRIYYDWEFRRRFAQTTISTKLGQTFILYFARFLLGYLVPPIMTNFWHVWPTNPSQDGLPYLDHLRYVRRTRYGPHHREELDELLPVEGQEYAHADRSKVFMPSGVAHMFLYLAREMIRCTAGAFAYHEHFLPTKLGRVKDECPAVLFAHGGGWVVQGTDVQLGQLSAIARGANMAVFTYNYPLAPEDPFPAAVVSTLRAMSYLKTNRGYSSLALVGDSAGGNLVTMAAMFVSNPDLMRKLAEAAQVDCDKWDYPQVSCVVSWYSILDDLEWKNPKLEHAWLQSGVQVVWDMYLGPQPALEGKCTVVQWKDEIRSYPPIFSLAGSYDPLGLRESTEAFHQMLTEQVGADQCEMKIYNGTHGFVGYPASFQQAAWGGDSQHWKQGCLQATLDTIAFLKKHHAHNLRDKVLGG